MKLTLVERPLVPPSASPYRLLDEQGQEVAWANAFLDAQRIRQLSLRSLRAYAYDLLHFARWFQDPSRPLSQITQSTLLDYVRHQLDQPPQPTPQTVNHRLVVVHGLYRFHYGQEIPPGQSHFQRTYSTRSPLGYGRPRPSPDFSSHVRGGGRGMAQGGVSAAKVKKRHPLPQRVFCREVGEPDEGLPT